MENEILVAYATIAIAVGTVGSLLLFGYYYRQQNIIAKEHVHYSAMLEVMEIFNEPRRAQERNTVYRAFREQKLYDANDEILPTYPDFTQSVDLPSTVASVRGSFDQMGKLVKEGYVRKEEFLDMYVDPVIRMGKVLERHILHEREVRKHEHFMTYFEEIFNDARLYWKEKFPNFPEPTPY